MKLPLHSHLRPGRLKTSAAQNKPLLFSSALFILVLSLTLVFNSPGARIAASIFTQDDWSGNVGTDPNQYAAATNMQTVTPGQLTLGSTTVSDWCNTPAECDSDWSMRQQLYLENQGEETTSQAVLVKITYRPEMNTDFSDIRFTDSSGTVLPYYLLDKTDSDQARFWVSTNVLPAHSNTLIYMYFGNATATTASNDGVVAFQDGFDNGNYNNWSNFGSGNPSLNNGFATLDPTNSGFGDVLRGGTPIDPSSVGKVMQFDAVVNGKTCSNQFSFNYSMVTNVSIDVYHSLSDDLIQQASDCENHYTIEINGEGPETHSDDNLLQLGTTYTFRIITDTAGNHTYYWSSNGGQTFNLVAPTSGSATPDNAPFIPHLGAWNGSGGNVAFGNLTITNYTSEVVPHAGIYEQQGGRTGTLESAIYDATGPATYQTIDYLTSGVGDSLVQVRSSNDSDMASATDWSLCPGLASGATITTANPCATNQKRYVQYRVSLATNDTNDFQLNSITIHYFVDTDGPSAVTNAVMKRENSSGRVIDENGWTNVTPYVSWDATSDIGQAGLAGYCAYLGTDSNPTMSTTAGLIGNTSTIDTGGACQYAQSATTLTPSLSSSLDNGQTYYYVVRPVDTVGNLGNATVTSFRYDNQPPSLATVFSAPVAVNSKIFSVGWLALPGTGILDSGSGPAGFKYCVTNVLLGFGGCDPDSAQNFFGLSHTTGDAHDPSDIVPFSAGQVTTTTADADRIDDAIAFANQVTIVAVDNAGNINTSLQAIIIVTHNAAEAPTNLAVTPSSNTSNAFSFTWDPPTQVFGTAADNDYCWTVNVSIAADGTNCNWTGKGITQLATGAYATQQGTNTFHIATKDITGNFDNTKVASITFSASTTAPGAPTNLDISDISTRTTSTWKLALSWTAPSLPGSGISRYKVQRSTDNATFSEVGTTSASNTSFIDSGLSQIDYYYRVVACDNANNCGAASNLVTLKPTGRFTEPAKLTADTDQPKVKNIGTKKATVYWFTDRESDSKVAYGTSPGNYAPEEVGNSAQVSTHSVTLPNLLPGTTYYYVSRWTDADGNTGQSSERSFTTAPPPTISEVVATDIGVTTANVSFRSKDASKVNVVFGQDNNFGGFKTINTAQRESNYVIPLSELQDGTKYIFRISGEDSDGNEYPGNTYSFTTPSRPKITNLKFQPVEGEPSSTLSVTWTTNVAASTQVSYGPKGAKATESLESKPVTDHVMIIRNLEDNTDYTLTAQSQDAGGNIATSDVQNFHTALDTRPPKVSNVNIETSVRGNGSESRGQIVVSWKTDEPSTSQVAYGVGANGSFSNKTTEDGRLTKEHTVVVSDLPTSSIYHLAAVSADKAGNSTKSQSITAIIGRGSDNVFTIIFTSLQKIFGLSN